MPITLSEPLYTLREVAEELGIALGTVRAHIQHGVLNVEKLANSQRTRLVTASELERFKRERRAVGEKKSDQRRKVSQESQTR